MYIYTSSHLKRDHLIFPEMDGKLYLDFLSEDSKVNVNKKEARKKNENNELVHHFISPLHTVYHLQKMDAVSF